MTDYPIFRKRHHLCTIKCNDNNRLDVAICIEKPNKMAIYDGGEI